MMQWCTLLGDTWFALRTQTMIPVPVYHAVYPESGPTNPLIADNIHNIAPEMLYEQLALLRKTTTVLPLDELADRIRQGKAVQGMAAITFDDGYRSVLTYAVPVLEALDIPATFFLSTKLVQSGAFWRDKVRYIISQGLVADFLRFAVEQEPGFQRVRAEHFYRDTKDPDIINSRLVETLLDTFLEQHGGDMNALSTGIYCHATDLTSQTYDGLTFGNHTHSHYVLSSISADEQYDDIALAASFLREMGLPCSGLFSIPFGGKRDFNQDTLAILHDLGYTGFVLSAGKSNVSASIPAARQDAQHDMVAIQRFMPPDTRWVLSN